MPGRKKTPPGMQSKAKRDLSDAAGLGERSQPPDVKASGEERNPVTSTSTRDVSGEGNRTAKDEVCSYGPCQCGDVDYERAGGRYCTESCADMQTDAEEQDRTVDPEEVEPCLCGHPGCSVEGAAAGGEVRLGRDDTI